jgi:hypothetical protein
MARILPFPVDSQLSAFPNEPPFDALRRINKLLANPEIAILRLQHDMLRLQRLAPYMSADQTLRVQGQVELLAAELDGVEAHIKQIAERQARAVGLTA